MTTRVRIKAGYGRASVLDALIKVHCPNCSGTGEYPGRHVLKGTIRCPACGHRPELAEHVRRSLWFEHARAYGARTQSGIVDLIVRRPTTTGTAPAEPYPNTGIS
ncbi:MAG: hypothetical protein U1E14_02535 [Geminicoccaceae bacterium]